ncbi:hypothetical protein C0995_006283 [Termitomyces sp. Mi166|nr:hypothetical protein C0995_006283 [Termitomyces sp. Mi166\
MFLSPAPALFVGLGARIALDYFTRSGEATVRDFVLIGVWQGVGLHYASKITALAIVLGFAIAAKLLVEFNFINDITRTVTTLLGIALGVLCTECLSQFFGSPNGGAGRRRKGASMAPDDHGLRRDRLVQFHNDVERDGNDARHRAFRETVHAVSDITSVGSHSDMIGPSASLSPMEIEIKTLKARAALADSERRRCREERKWAISQGNLARASQMKSRVKHYTTLMQKFSMEADAKTLQGEYQSPGYPFQVTIFILVPNARPRQEAKPSSSKLPNRFRQESVNGQSNGHDPKPSSSKLASRPRPSSGAPNGQDPRPSSKPSPLPFPYSSSGQPNGQFRSSSEARHLSKQSRP